MTVNKNGGILCKLSLNEIYRIYDDSERLHFNLKLQTKITNRSILTAMSHYCNYYGRHIRYGLILAYN